MRGFLSQKSGRARLRAGLGLSVGISLCAGALVCGPLARPVAAAPTIGGDENGPQVQVLQPAYQDVLKGKTKILIAVKAQKFNPQFIEMFVDDKPATPGPISLSALPSAQYDWDTKLFADGPHKLMVRVTDTQGFRGWAEVTVIINNGKKLDSSPPSLKWQNTKSFQQLSGTASIQLDALDSFGVKWLFISLSKASEPNQKLRSWMLNRPPYTVKLDTTQVPDGVYQLSAKAFNSFEEEGEAPPITLGVVNNVLNATTVGDMLAGLQRVEESNQKPAPQAKAGRRFTVDAPETESTQNVAPKARSGASAPVTTKPVDTKPKVVAPKASSPALAPMIVRDLPPASPQIVAIPQVNASVKPTGRAGMTTGPQIAKPRVAKPEVSRPQIAKLAPPVLDESEIAAPQFSDRAELKAPLALSQLESEIDGALSNDWRAQLARAGAPETNTRTEIARLTLPAGGARALESDANSAPVWSQNQDLDASRRVALAPLKVEIETGAEAGRVSAPQLVARSESGVSEALSPQISAVGAVPQTKISARQAIGAKIDALKTVRAGKTAAPGTTRVAALPRPAKNEARGAINAITVSPLQVNVSDALPAFHVATRASDLRAVAARYGLPVEVLAANNGWNQDKTLAAGERVKLPTQLKVAYRGAPVVGDAPSMLVGGTGVTAFRFLFEQAGGKLTWDAKKQRVLARKGDSEVVLSIGSNRAKVGDKDVMLELAAFLFEGRTMVPVRFFEEGLRAEVEWDPQTGRLVVAMAN